jgi:hypothetical protein
MHTYLSQGLVAGRNTEMLRQAETARLASDVKRARRASRVVLTRLPRTVRHARRPQRAGLPAA